jgi:ABC-type polysaccharide/polyol phosphate transport system ATPase subunit
MLEVQGVGIKFHRNRRKRMQLRELVIKGHTGPTIRGEFWALRDVSFTVRAGEAVGVVGANGTGKSTLLKIIAGVLIPDEGSVSLTLFPVSHSEADLRRFCERGLYLREGGLAVDGPIEKALAAYHEADPRKAPRAARR